MSRWAAGASRAEQPPAAPQRPPPKQRLGGRVGHQSAGNGRLHTHIFVLQALAVQSQHPKVSCCYIFCHIQYHDYGEPFTHIITCMAIAVLKLATKQFSGHLHTFLADLNTQQVDQTPISPKKTVDLHSKTQKSKVATKQDNLSFFPFAGIVGYLQTFPYSRQKKCKIEKSEEFLFSDLFSVQ